MISDLTVFASFQNEKKQRDQNGKKGTKKKWG
jgi:hypothetical protein